MSVKLADNFQIREHSWPCLFHIMLIKYYACSLRLTDIVTTKTEQYNGITMFNTSNEGTEGLGISYSSRKMRGKLLNFI